MAGLLNRAYERLNKVLALAGSQTVNDIDIASAFAVHDLTPVVQDKLVLPAIFGLSEAVNAGVAEVDSVDPFTPTAWANVYIGNNQNADTQLDYPDRGNWDFILTDFKVLEVNGFGDSAQLLYGTDVAGILQYFPVTGLLDVLETTSNAMAPSDGVEYWQVALPYRVFTDFGLLNYRLVAGGGGACTFRVYMAGWFAYKGAYVRPV